MEARKLLQGKHKDRITLTVSRSEPFDARNQVEQVKNDQIDSYNTNSFQSNDPYQHLNYSQQPQQSTLLQPATTNKKIFNSANIRPESKYLPKYLNFNNNNKSKKDLNLKKIYFKVR